VKELGDLNTEQLAAVLHDQGPVLVIAGAGTGKTQVITRRIAHLISTKKAQPHEILAVTFTDKAARQMEERLDLILPYGIVDTKVMTFHSFGSEILERFGPEIGLDARLGLLNQTQQLIFLKEHFDELKLNYFAPIASPDSLLFSLVGYFSRLREELIQPQDYIDLAKQLGKKAVGEAEHLEASRQLELARAYYNYQRLLRSNGLIDFSDQVSLALDLLVKRPNLLAKLQTELKYILVDEFQDTNLAQAQLIEKIAGPAGNIMVVGDDDQSIYKFRGAAISNILNFSERYPNAKKVVLNQNYRSSQEILDSAYRLIQKNNPEKPMV
jgi:DNA helicase-2/ATP-dependent DNA helicase PcrA